MPTATIRVLDANKPANSLAVWLAYHHPDLFVAAARKARAAQAGKKPRLGRLADDSDIMTTFDMGADIPTVDASNLISPDLTSFTPDLATINIDTTALDALPDNLITDAGDSSVLSAIGDGLTSAGSTVSNAIGGGVSGVLSALGSVASYLGSPTGINSITGLAKAYFGAQTAASQAQTAASQAQTVQAAVVQTQIARAATQQPVAPITYARAATGQVIPVYTNGQPVTSAGLASLTPSNISVFLSQYGMWLLLGGAVAVVMSRM